MSTPTLRTFDTLRMIGELEGNAGAYIASTLDATDLTGGWVNPTHARQLQRSGYIEQIVDGEPLRLTRFGRETAGLAVDSSPDPEGAEAAVLAPDSPTTQEQQ